jgi:shikimate dehydrogenase
MSNSNHSPFILAGVMGWPVGHSRSPVIHNHWIAHHQLKGSYALLPVQPERMDAIKGLVALGFAGCNVTIPHKVSAMKMMDDVHPTAQRMGAINTIVVQKDGALHGFNNDGFGYIQSLKDEDPHWRADKGPILILGAGGASRAITLSLLEQGAKEIDSSTNSKKRLKLWRMNLVRLDLGRSRSWIGASETMPCKTWPCSSTPPTKACTVKPI